ncbi:glycoside hydrolase family 43 protein [Paenibacillus crassostreae]|uniref:glycoside hydrolase family 43 protein n=1 Tax=Paenibacillus crassostreae TaxID=1763538 RepID=UPI0012FFC777|nr:glycoside hydrolase family 43 protein [Paenibacillus crassostreae]
MTKRWKWIGLLLFMCAIAIGMSLVWQYSEKELGDPVPFTNPVYQSDAPDPTVLKADDGYYYAVTTQTDRDGTFTPLPILQSKDLVNWEERGTVFTVESVPEWTTYNYFWAPHLTYHDGKYYVYYSTMLNDNIESTGMGIGVAVADHPEGPYVDKGEPVLAGISFDTIDPFVFDDEDGKRYMYWGSNGMPIYAQELASDGMSVIGKKTEAIWAGQYDVRDGYDKLVEGPWVIKRENYYYMFYSGDYCCQVSGHNAHYAVMVARSESPMGPYEIYANNPILDMNDKFLAPGHNAVIQDDAGQDWILYHAYDLIHADVPGRAMLLDRIDWENGWPVINGGKGPTSELQTDGPVVQKR